MQNPIRRLTPREIASNYDRIARHFQQDRSSTIGINYVDRFCAIVAHRGVVLDVGCGTGIPITKRLVDREFTVHALDLSEKMIFLAKRNVKGVTFFNADITTWVSPSHYDAIIAWDSIFHLTITDQLKVLESFVRMLKSKGIVLITCGVKEGEVNSSMFGEEFYYSSPSLTRYIDLIEGLRCTICFFEIDDSTNGGHAVICFQKPS